MKTKIVMLFVCFAIVTFANAQQRDTTSAKMSDYDLGMTYLQKSRSQKTTAWILLGVGLVGYIGGVIAYENAWNNWDLSSNDPGTGALIVAYIGLGCTVASIPVFINAAKNKGRAEILLRNENILMSYKPQQIRSLPSVGVGITLGR